MTEEETKELEENILKVIEEKFTELKESLESDSRKVTMMEGFVKELMGERSRNNSVSAFGHMGRALDSLHEENRQLTHRIQDLQQQLAMRKSVTKKMEDGTTVTTYE